jgi:hypothetical protein
MDDDGTRAGGDRAARGEERRGGVAHVTRVWCDNYRTVPAVLEPDLDLLGVDAGEDGAVADQLLAAQRARLGALVVEPLQRLHLLRRVPHVLAGVHGRRRRRRGLLGRHHLYFICSAGTSRVVTSLTVSDSRCRSPARRPRAVAMAQQPTTRRPPTLLLAS